MSTAGKVLTGLVLLMLPIWIVLVSAVTQLNASWREVLRAEVEKVAKLEQSVLDNQKEIQRLKDRILIVQVSGEEQATVLREKLADVERIKAEAINIQTAVKNQIESLTAAGASAAVARDRRKEEKEQEIQATAAAEKAVNELKAENAELMTQLTQLRQEFRSLLESNKALVQRMGRPRVQRAVQPGSSTR